MLQKLLGGRSWAWVNKRSITLLQGLQLPKYGIPSISEILYCRYTLEPRPGLEKRLGLSVHPMTNHCSSLLPGFHVMAMIPWNSSPHEWPQFLTNHFGQSGHFKGTDKEISSLLTSRTISIVTGVIIWKPGLRIRKLLCLQEQQKDKKCNAVTLINKNQTTRTFKDSALLVTVNPGANLTSKIWWWI